MEESTSRRLYTSVLFSTFVSIGMGLQIIGPTLLDLSLQTNESLTIVSTCLTARAAGYITGSLMSE